MNYLRMRNKCSVSRKKEQNVFRNIFYKTQAILIKFGTPFPE